LLTPLMYQIPTDFTVEKVVITPEVVARNAPPRLVYNQERKPVKIKISSPRKRGRKDTAS
ncbi:MAG TPA: ATP-dependent Clp protease ATP-binding subunit ClpX, partial [Ruminococcaceae bacterium]|nr:ATP-dependent Clp protease ATP-binding subunit ClpX [Oscillospiraceae bacterium]